MESQEKKNPNEIPRSINEGILEAIKEGNPGGILDKMLLIADGMPENILGL